MSASAERIDAQIADLRRSFDTGFALPARTPDADAATLLVVRTGGMASAVRITDLVRVEACRDLIPLPAQPAAFLGLASLQGRATAAYSLARLLGKTHAEGDGRWLLVVHGGLAVAVSGIQGCVRIREDELHHEASDTLQPMVPLATGHCPLIDLTALVQPLLRPSGVRRTTPQE